MKRMLKLMECIHKTILVFVHCLFHMLMQTLQAKNCFAYTGNLAVSFSYLFSYDNRSTSILLFVKFALILPLQLATTILLSILWWLSLLMLSEFFHPYEVSKRCLWEETLKDGICTSLSSSQRVDRVLCLVVIVNKSNTCTKFHDK